MQYQHDPVMIEEVMEFLHPEQGGYYIDATVGGAGYLLRIAEKAGEKGRVLGIDLDEMAIQNAEIKIKENKIKNIEISNESFKNIEKIAKEKFEDKNIKFDGIVFDLGLSSAQLADRSRGFSFQLAAPLNMAFGSQIQDDATIKIVNNYNQKSLEKIFKEYGEERFSSQIAAAIAKRRKSKKITTTDDLKEIILEAIPGFRSRSKIHPATKVFQALRIETNQELKALSRGLEGALNLLKPGGRLVVVSFHSLEDRIVKQFFKKESQNCICPKELPECRCDHKRKIKIITKKPVAPSPEEIKKNKRARSAKLRAAEKVA